MEIDSKERRLIILSLLLATIAEASSLLYPQMFVPRLILHYGYKQEEVGYYVGLLNSARYLGNIGGALFWSSLSDSRGRRPVILLNIFCSLPCNLLFGLSANLPMAVAARLLTGATSAVIPLCKTVVYEVTDRRTQVAAMSIVNFGFVFGVILAANVGAFLTDPYTQYGEKFPNFRLLRARPFVLPSLVYCCYATCVLLLCCRFLRETGPAAARAAVAADVDAGVGVDADVDVDVDKCVDAGVDGEALDDSPLHRSASELRHPPPSPLRRCRSHQQLGDCPRRRRQQSAAAAAATASTFGLVAQLAASTAALPTERQSRQQPQPEFSCQPATAQPGACAACLQLLRRLCTIGASLFRDFPNFKVVLLAYTVTSSATIMFDECVNVFALDRSAGLRMEPRHLGIVNNIALLAMCPFILLLPLLNSRLGPMRMHMLGLVIGLVSITSFPLTVLLKCPYSLGGCVLGVGLLLTAKNICLFWCFTTVSVLLNNSVPPALAGTANGIGIVFSNVSRILGITVGTSLLQFTLNRDLAYPLDQNLVFLLVGSLLCLCAFVQSTLPASIEAQVHKN